MPKIIAFDDEARRALESGMNQLANAVRITLGPKGRNVVLDKKWGAPTITNDGVSTAKVLAWTMVHEGLRNVAAGANPMGLKRGIEAGVAAAVEAIKAASIEVDSKEQIAQVASISAADEEIGDMISAA